jgi:hypothetical protein
MGFFTSPVDDLQPDNANRFSPKAEAGKNSVKCPKKTTYCKRISTPDIARQLKLCK